MPNKTPEVNYTTTWFPLVGAIVGLIIAQTHKVASYYWSPAIAATIAVALGLMLTGGLHEDGATDAADGLGGGWAIEQIIEIMHDSRIGAYGAMALWCLLMLRWSVLITVNNKSLIILPLAMAWGRWSMVITLQLLPSLTTGLSSTFKSSITKQSTIAASIITIGITIVAAVMGYSNAFYLIITSSTTTICWIAYIKSRIGGQTGDLLGAGNQLVEAAALLTLCIK